MDVKKTFGNNLKTFRKNANLSQEELASKVGVSAKHIGAIETGVSFVSSELLEQFSLILSVPIYKFFCADEIAIPETATVNTIDNIVNLQLQRTAMILKNEIHKTLLLSKK